MNPKILLLAALLASPFPTAAPAQDKPTQDRDPAVPGTGFGTSASGSASPSGIRQVPSARDATTLVGAKPGNFLTSQLIGTVVYDGADEKIGEIVDLLVPDGRTIGSVVLKTTGRLGIGTKYIVVEPSSLVLSPGGETFRAVLNAGKGAVEAAPEFKFQKNY